MKKVLFIAVVLLLSCGNNRLETQDLIISKESPDEVPEYFRPPQAKVRISGAFSSGSFLAAPEAAVVFESGQKPEEISAFYEAAMKKNDWHIIQSMNRSGETLLMAEAEYRKMATIIIRDSSPAIVKIYIKRSND